MIELMFLLLLKPVYVLCFPFNGDDLTFCFFKLISFLLKQPHKHKGHGQMTSKIRPQC